MSFRRSSRFLSSRVSRPISSGSRPRPPAAERSAARSPVFACALGAALALSGTPAAAEPKLLDPERAFALSVRALDERTVEARFAIADGYYLYRDKLRVSVSPGAAAPVVLPPGEIHEDEFFGKVATYRKGVAARVVLDAPAPGAKVTVTAVSQGCADAGVCYLPQTQRLDVVLPAPGAPPGPPVYATPPRKTWLQ